MKGLRLLCAGLAAAGEGDKSLDDCLADEALILFGEEQEPSGRNWLCASLSSSLLSSADDLGKIREPVMVSHKNADLPTSQRLSASCP